MKEKIAIGALIAMMPVLGHAQNNVSVYGIVDTALAYEDTGAQGVKSRMAIHAGQSTSRLGFRGTEDLGGGLKAMFNVESGFAADTGASVISLFGLRAVVGLEGGFGQLTLGREYTPVDNISGQSHAMGQGFYGTNLNAFVDGPMTRRLSNSVNYKSRTLGGFRFSAAVGLGEATAGPSQTTYTGGVEYASGPLYAGFAYAATERSAIGDDEEMIFGAAYTLAGIEFKGNYMVGDQAGPNNKYTQANVGAVFGAGTGKLHANVQQSKRQNGARANGYSLSYSHPLSKRTNVYASLATNRNNALGNFSLSAAGSNITPPATARGADPKAMAIGLRHIF